MWFSGSEKEIQETGEEQYLFGDCGRWGESDKLMLIVQLFNTYRDLIIGA